MWHVIMSEQDISLDKLMELYTFKRYLTRTEILFRARPNLTRDFNGIWNDILISRKHRGYQLSLRDLKGSNFWYMMPPFAEKLVHDLSFVAKHKLEELTTKEIFKKLLIEDMMFEEAFYSSVIEGAFTTKKRAKEVVKSKEPKDNSEQMILNNYSALVFILENIERPLDEKIFLEIFKIVTRNTLEDDEITEKYRDGPVYVTDPSKTEPIYVPPDAVKVQLMMDDLFIFINTENESEFIHPIIKAFIIHFYIGYVHPFFDGNGRVSRAFSYMYLLKQGYDFFRFFSISSMINEHRKKYYKSFIDSEDNGCDLTYFIIAHLQISLDSIKKVLDRLIDEFQSQLLQEKLQKEGIMLSKRQKKFIRFIEKKDNNLVTIDDYRKKNNISYETARKDLMGLEQIGLFRKVKKGNKNIFAFQGLKGFLELK